MLSDADLYARGMEVLVSVVQELSLARDLAGIMAIARRAARRLTGADGATFVLRDNSFCHYADEDAIAPLWKGKRFPLQTCISGWAMLHREAVVLEDIYADARIPADAYRPTFVKSLVMVPIRRMDPVGAIGNYWATQQRPSETQVRLLQALADSTATAMANVDLLSNLEARVAERTAQLEAINKELEAFSYAVSHDLRAPLRVISAFTRALTEDHADMLGSGNHYLDRITAASTRMSGLIDDLLKYSQIASSEVERQTFDLVPPAREILAELRDGDPTRNVEVTLPDALPVHSDPRLVRVVLDNLLHNAWKFTSRRAAAHIELGKLAGAFYVRDDGAGFDSHHASQLFTPFRRLHTTGEFEGTGVGLATVQRAVQRHGGRIWAESEVDKGATFFFTFDGSAR